MVLSANIRLGCMIQLKNIFILLNYNLQGNLFFPFRHFSRSFGLTLLIMLASCLLHLVATSYFLFIELLGDPVGIHIQYISILFHKVMFQFLCFYFAISLLGLGCVCRVSAIVMVLFSSIATTFDCWTMSYGNHWSKWVTFITCHIIEVMER